MLHTRIARSNRWTPWGFLRNPRGTPLRRAATGGDNIHSAWCKCDGCASVVERRRALRGDLFAIALGLSAALAALAADTLLGLGAR